MSEGGAPNAKEGTGPLLDSDGETSEGVTVEEVGRPGGISVSWARDCWRTRNVLVEDEALGLAPHGGGDDDLDLLSSRKTKAQEQVSDLADRTNGRKADPLSSLYSAMSPSSPTSSRCLRTSLPLISRDPDPSRDASRSSYSWMSFVKPRPMSCSRGRCAFDCSGGAS